MISGIQFHRKAYLLLLILLAMSQPFSVFATSFLQILLVLNWIIEGNYREKWNRLKAEKAFWVYLSFYIIYMLGMLWSSDLDYGLKDLKIKLPLIIVPFLVVSSDPLDLKDLKSILSAFIAACLAASLVTLLAILHILPVEMHEYRNASLFISHIRFSLMIVLSIAFSIYLVFIDRKRKRNAWYYMYLFAIVWLTAFLVILRSLSGIVILIMLLLFLSIHVVSMVRDRAIRFMITVLIVFIPLFAIVYTGNAINRFYSFDQVVAADIDSLTINGNPYINHPDNKETENGHFVWIHVCPAELESEWAKVSDLEYAGLTENGDQVKYTLIRYLTSRGLRKDSAGMSQLTLTDIKAIESGIANHIYLDRLSLYPRIYEVIWEFDRYRLGYSANDKSLMQRYFYLKAGTSIALENVLIGVGTGDVRASFDNFYDKIDSPLRVERRRRAHNQFLTFAITFGLPGFILCLLALTLPVFIKRRWRSYMLLVFIFTLALSFLSEDTLENTPGVVMFGFFYGLFVFGPEWPWKSRP